MYIYTYTHTYLCIYVCFMSRIFAFESYSCGETHMTCLSFMNAKSMPQHATHYNILQHTATHYNILQHTATHYNILLHTATHTAPHCTTLQTLHHTAKKSDMNAPQQHHAAPHCPTLHHTAPHCTTLQHTAPHCTTLHYTALHCNTLQHLLAVHKRKIYSPREHHCGCLTNLWDIHIWDMTRFVYGTDI